MQYTDDWDETLDRLQVRGFDMGDSISYNEEQEPGVKEDMHSRGNWETVVDNGTEKYIRRHEGFYNPVTGAYVIARSDRPQVSMGIGSAAFVIDGKSKRRSAAVTAPHVLLLTEGLDIVTTEPDGFRWNGAILNPEFNSNNASLKDSYGIPFIEGGKYVLSISDPLLLEGNSFGLQADKLFLTEEDMIRKKFESFIPLNGNMPDIIDDYLPPAVA